jgi:hypothetical protein
MVRKNRLIILAFISIVALYILVTLIVPPENKAVHNRYQLSPVATRLLSLTVILPMLAIYTLGFISHLRLRRYADTIKNSVEAKAFEILAYGILALTLYLPASSVITNSLSYIYHHNSALTGTMIIMTNYLQIVLLLATFVTIWIGSHKLIGTIKRPRLMRLPFVLGIIYGASSVVYAYLILRTPTEQAEIARTGNLGAYMTTGWLFFTIVVPYLVIWLLGVLAIENMFRFRKSTKGVIYRQALARIATGVGVFLTSFMLIRYLSTLTNWLDSLTLKLLLTIVYCLVLLIGVGFALVALGVRRLQQIEEV